MPALVAMIMVAMIMVARIMVAMIKKRIGPLSCH